MSTSAKRYGLEVRGDLELELRLRRMEAKLETLAGSSDFGDSGAVQRVTDVPIVTGLRVLGRTPGAITVAWNQLRLSDLRRYELEIAGNLAFTSNKQTFNVAGTEFQFSSQESEGGGGGATIYARVRARTTNGNTGNFSAVLNTTTGQAQTADIADSSVTEEKTESGSLPPGIVVSDALSITRVNSAGTELEYAFTMPATPAASKLFVGDGTNIDQTAWTVPASMVANKLLVGSGGNVEQTAWTVPTSVSSGRILRASSANVLGQTLYEMPSVATADSVLVGDGTNYVLQSQDPTDGAATTTTHSNRAGSVTLAGGLTLHWDTIDTVSGVDSTVATFTAVRSVMACWGEAAGTAAPVKAYISTANTTITIRQDSGANMEVTYWAIEEL